MFYAKMGFFRAVIVQIILILALFYVGDEILVGEIFELFPLQKIQLNPCTDTSLPWIVSRLETTRCVTDSSLLLGSMNARL